MREGVGGVADQARRALAHYVPGAGVHVEPIVRGLINETWRFRTESVDGVLQRLNPIFPPEINLDIDRVTSHLAGAGQTTPRLLRTLDGQPWVDLAEDGVWRALTWVPGHTLDRAERPATLREAAALLGRFHRCTSALTIPFRFRRPQVHDTDTHLSHLCQVTPGSGNDPATILAHEIVAAGETLSDLPATDDWTLHGDPKLNNVRFDAAGRALCLVDLDTLRRGPLAHDLGDAWRSWCNRAGEDEAVARLDLGFLNAAVQGYASEMHGSLTPDEIASLPTGLERIALELAARFCADVFEDRYFGWDAARFASRREHNLVRARGQLSLYRAVVAAREEIVEIVTGALG